MPAPTLPLAEAALALVFLWLLLFLMPIPCLLHAADQGVSNHTSPIRNLRMDPVHRRLTWDLSGNITDLMCISGLGAVRRATGRHYCQYPFLPVCRATNFTVRTTRQPQFSASILYPRPGGIPGAAAEHLQCQVHDVDQLSCSWDVGSAAPSDVQYELQWEDLQTQQVQACGHYGSDPHGIHVCCTFMGIVGASGQLQRFWVTGRSRAGIIPCTEIERALPEIESLSVRNLSSTCREAHAELRWDVQSLFQTGFQYQVQTQKDGEMPQNVTMWENHMVLPHAGDFSVKIRVQSLDYVGAGQWGPWAPTQRFSCSPRTHAPLGGVWLPAVLAVLSTLLAAVAVFLLWSRSSLPQKLFPPIPQLRDPFRDRLPSDQLVVPDKQECTVAAVEILGENPPSPAGPTGSGEGLPSPPAWKLPPAPSSSSSWG